MYAELVSRSNYSFLRGASHPEELVSSAAAVGLCALAITDDDGLYGLVKAHLEAKQHNLKLVLASRLTLTDAPPIAVYVQNAEGYAHLCELISESRLAHPKGHAGLPWTRVRERASGLAMVFLDGEHDPRVAAALAEAFPGRSSVGVSRHLSADDEARWLAARNLSRAIDVPLLAHNDVHTHSRERQPLQDVMTAIRLGITLANAGTLVFPNGERVLKSPHELLGLFSDAPECLSRTMELVNDCSFTLDELHYTFSEEELPPGMNRSTYLAHLCELGLRVRYPSGVPDAVRRQIEKELRLITALEYEGYFLALWDIVRFARDRGILCQGRGSAANSAVCYVLQITAIDPVRMGLLFERFLSMERREPPDIDVDFEHARREEVLQYVYEKHGRHRAAMVCEHICFRGKLSVKEVGKTLGLSVDQLDRLSKAMDLSDDVGPYQLHQAGLSASDVSVQQTMALARQLSGMPRHLSIHVGGFVITHGPLVSLAPVETGAMQDRTVVQWEKDDLSALDILKVDLLGLGMLTVVARSFELIETLAGRRYDMATVPAEDPAVYDMLCDADTVGVFQIESRAQQNMLPRLKPRTFYDLVVEIAIIRPGPIVGEMVHPYLRRRNGEEPVTYPSPDVQSILERTLGVPLFQEQAMKLAMVAAGFTPGDADALRRALSHKRAHELLPKFRDRYIEGCVGRGYERAFAEKSFDSFKGFSHYGFPESHSASFALIAYVSSWLKRYYPAVFCAALLDAQPMGFYAPHTLVDDARRHGVEARAVDVNCSIWKCQLELDGRMHEGLRREPTGGVMPDQPALRLGFELVKGLKQETVARLLAERERGGVFQSLAELARRTRIPRAELTRLVLSGALASITTSRRAALWELSALGTFDEGDLFFGIPMATDTPPFPAMSATERVATDFDTVGLSLESHPVGLLRAQLTKAGAMTAEQLQKAPNGKTVRLGGLVIVRQRPPTAKGFCFMSVEDESGLANLVIEPRRFEQYRKEITGTALVLAVGRVERSGKVVNLKVDHLEPLMPEA
jgi:error-prone DNA polymerase